MSKGDGKSSGLSAMPVKNMRKMKMKAKTKMMKKKNGPLLIAPIRPFSTSILMSALYILKQNQKKKREDDQIMGRFRYRERLHYCTKLGKAVGVGITQYKYSMSKSSSTSLELKEMEGLVADIRSEHENERRLLQEGEAKVKELQALLAQTRETNNQFLAMNLRDELLAQHIYFNIILP